MRQIALVLTLILLFTSNFASSQTKAGVKDEEFKNKIVGSWSEGESPFGIATFKKNGVYEAKGYNTPKMLELIIYAEGKWWIEDGKLYNTIHKVEPSTIPVKKEPYIDIIVDITDDIMTLIDDEGKKYIKKKVN